MIKPAFDKPTSGETLKKIRMSKKYTQKFVTEGIISQSTYSKIERGEVEPTYSKFMALLKRLDVSPEEFNYLSNDHSQTDRDKIINDFFLLNYNNSADLVLIRSRIKRYLNSHKDYVLQDIFYICHALILINENRDYDQAVIFANKVWKRLEKFDRWFLMEIRLINTILFIFPIETAINISEKTVGILEEYSSREGKVLLNNIQINLALLLIRNKQYKVANKMLDTVIKRLKDEKNYYLLAFAYIRKGIALRLLTYKKSDFYLEKGLSLLELFEDPKLYEVLSTEIDFYTKKTPNAH